ncbi:MAG: ferrous iron transport protein A [Fusobacteriaceae bacterium]|jgi:ferrous iron transport protein A|nr:ferrous iron transport protein A [Fusobacteriaceae bacterium]
MMPLSFADVGAVVAIKKIGGLDETRRFLNNLGFVEGSRVSVISKTSGNVIVNVKESRVALGKQTANKIIVDEENMRE